MTARGRISGGVGGSLLPPGGPGRLAAGGRAALRDGLDRAAYLLGLDDVRADRAPRLLTVRLGGPGDDGLTLIDRRGAEPRSYRFDPLADDLGERLAAIRGGQADLGAKILVDPAACFFRSLTLPSAALPRMRAVLAQELEAATPFRAGSVHSDWYVEGEDAASRSLHVRHVVLKRARLDPLLTALARAGIAAGPVTVGTDEARSVPVDLLTGGHRSVSGLAGFRAGDLALLSGAILLVLAAFWGVRAHQEATLAGLDEAFAAARRSAGPAMSAPVQAGTAAILAGRAPAIARSWNALAASLPDSASATDLHLDADSALLTVLATDEAAALAALAAVPGFGAPFLREASAGPDGARRLVVLLPRSDPGTRP